MTALAAGPLQAGSVADGGAQRCANLVASFAESPPPLVLRQLQRELDAVLEPGALEVRFSSGNTADLRKGERCEAVVIQLWGGCRPGSGGVAPKPGSLAWTYSSDDKILPLVNVDCDRTRALLSPELAGQPNHLREVYFGRALGRILAHELWHVLGNQAGHEADGLARAELSVADLLRRKLRLRITP